MAALLALMLATAAPATGVVTRLPPAPIQLWKVAWQRKLVPPTTLEWQARELGGPAIDPVSGYVVVGARDGRLRAFDPDGVLVWSFDGAGRFDAPARIDRDTVYAGCDDGRLYAIELGSGKLRWSYDAQEEVGTTPVVAGDLVVAMTLQDTLFAVDARTGAWKWHHRRDTREGFTVRGAAPALVIGDVAVGAYSDGAVAVVDFATGAARWERKVAPVGDFMDVDGMCAQGGQLFVAAFSGAVLALDLASGQQQWEYRTPAPARIELLAGAVVAVTTTQVVALSPRDGRVRWTTPLGGQPAGDPIFVAGRIAVPRTTSLLWLDAASGRTLRHFDPGTGVSATPAALGRRVYVLTNGGDLLALDMT
jgi:outer membrane protein assembly factor BamB